MPQRLMICCAGEPKLRYPIQPHARAELGLGFGQATAAVEEEFLVSGQPVLMTGQHALQCQVRRRRGQPCGLGGAVRLDMRHAAFGKRLHQQSVTHQRLSLILRAAVRSQKPVMRRRPRRAPALRTTSGYWAARRLVRQPPLRL
jgi:hypothetical protein